MTEGSGIPLSIVVDGANRHDMKLLKPTLHHMPLCYPPLSRQSVNVCLDKGYDYDAIRDYLSGAGFVPHVRSRGEEKKQLAQAPEHPARRWVVERTHGWLNRYRRLLVRWEKKAQNYTAMLHFACGLITYRQTGLFG